MFDNYLTGKADYAWRKKTIPSTNIGSYFHYHVCQCVLYRHSQPNHGPALSLDLANFF